MLSGKGWPTMEYFFVFGIYFCEKSVIY